MTSQGHMTWLASWQGLRGNGDWRHQNVCTCASYVTWPCNVITPRRNVMMHDATPPPPKCCRKPPTMLLVSYMHTSPNVLHMKITLIFWSQMVLKVARKRPVSKIKSILSQSSECNRTKRTFRTGSFAYYSHDHLTNSTWPGDRVSDWGLPGEQYALILNMSVSSKCTVYVNTVHPKMFVNIL